MIWICKKLQINERLLVVCSILRFGAEKKKKLASTLGCSVKYPSVLWLQSTGTTFCEAFHCHVAQSWLPCPWLPSLSKNPEHPILSKLKVSKTQKDTICAKTHGTKLTPNRVHKPSNKAKSSAVRPRDISLGNQLLNAVFTPMNTWRNFTWDVYGIWKASSSSSSPPASSLITFTLLTLTGIFLYKTCSSFCCSSSLPRWELRPSAQWSNRDVAWPWKFSLKWSCLQSRIPKLM